MALFEDIIKSKKLFNLENRKFLISNKGMDIDKKNEIGNVKRKYEEISSDETENNNNNKKMNIQEKYSTIIEEINLLKNKYKMTVNVIDISKITLILKTNNNKNYEIPWNEFIGMINKINKEELNQRKMLMTNASKTSTTLSANSPLNNSTIMTTSNTNTTINNNTNTSSITNTSTSNDNSSLKMSEVAKENNDLQKQNVTKNNERVMLVISLNLSSFIESISTKNEYIPNDQSNIIIYARIPKSTLNYYHHGLFDWNITYLKNKSIFQTSDEDNRRRERRINEFVAQKIQHQKTSNENSTIKLQNIIEWTLEGIKN